MILPRLSKQEIIRQLRQWVKKHQRVPTYSELKAGTIETCTSPTILKHFGTWDNAIKAAGIIVTLGPLPKEGT